MVQPSENSIWAGIFKGADSGNLMRSFNMKVDGRRRIEKRLFLHIQFNHIMWPTAAYKKEKKGKSVLIQTSELLLIAHHFLLSFAMLVCVSSSCVVFLCLFPSMLLISFCHLWAASCELFSSRVTAASTKENCYIYVYILCCHSAGVDIWWNLCASYELWF